MEFLKIWDIILRRKWIIISISLIFIVIVAIGTQLATPQYKAKAKILVKASGALSSLLTTLGIERDEKSTSETYETEKALVTATPLLKELISLLGLNNRKGEPIKPDKLIEWSLINKILFQPYIEVSQYEDSDILEIVSISSDPLQAADMSNKLSELFINDSINRISHEYKEARVYIEKQIIKVQNEYYESLAAIKNYQIKEESINLNLDIENLIEKIESLKNSYDDNERALLTLEKEIKKSQEELKGRKKFRKESEELTESDELKNLRSKTNDLLVTMSSKSIDLSKEHPDYRELEKQIETVRDIMKKEAEVVFSSERHGVDPTYESLYDKIVSNSIQIEINLLKRNLFIKYIDQYQDELLKMPLKSSDLAKLELALSTPKEMYKKLLEYHTNINIAESIALSDIRLVEPASVPYEPDFPKKSLLYVLGILLGTFWGLTMAFFLEYIDNTIKSPENVRSIESLSLLGTIPQKKQLENYKVISKLDPMSPVTEAFRSVRNSIRYTCIVEPKKSFLITSSMDSEGKSSLTANLSITLSKKGRSVIIVDLNLRRPSIHKFFDIPDDTMGVTNFIAEDFRIEEAVIHTDIEGLDLLPSGPLTNDPVSLIESDRLKNVIETLKEMYDYVIIDTPATGLVNDPLVIGRYVDGIVYLIQSGRVTYTMVEHIKLLIEDWGLNLIGVVLNRFNAPISHDYYYYYKRYNK